VAGKEGEVVTR